jgi:hypothetical protein
MFTTPETDIVTQNEESDNIYYILKGDCIVNITDENSVLHVAIRLLTEGN